MVVVALLAAGAWAAYSAMRGPGALSREELETQVEALGARVASLEQENAKLRTEAAAAERQSMIERSARENIARQMKSLAEEVAAAKDETAILQTLLGQGGKAGVSVSRFRVERDAEPRGFRYRLTVVHASGATRDFQGQLRLVANVVQDGRPVSLPLTDANGAPLGPTALSFRLFQPVEGSFRLPANATLRSLEARVFENGVAQPRAVQTAPVS
jgi:Ser/Thr protein kinase RdoA (MazF antagonist)